MFFRNIKRAELLKVILLLVFLGSTSCKKLIEIDPPTRSIVTTQVFSDSINALSALGGIYSRMINRGGINFGSGYISVYCGSSADELRPFQSTGDLVSTNTLTSSSNPFFINVWAEAYNNIYQTNAILEALPESFGITETTKRQISGETKFFRAFFYFYLVNLFGEVPIITSTDYKTNALIPRAPVPAVYEFIIRDLKEAQSVLPGDYSAGSGERIRINKWSATALLARVYLYIGKYDVAEIQTSSIIENVGTFSLVGDLNEVFLKNSSEAILQWQVNSNLNISNFNATPEGAYLIPTLKPNHYLTTQFLNGFEFGDERRNSWVDSFEYRGGGRTAIYYYPFKYKVGYKQAQPNGDVSEYYMVFRLAEQYLIRAESRIQQGNLTGAAQDINSIRNRAGLSNTTATTQVELLAAVAQERRSELFVEWGHRWLDLKRTGRARDELSWLPYKSEWQDFQQLYPIGRSELKLNPNLTQNPGYQ